MAFGKPAKHMLTQSRIKGGFCCVQRPSHRSSYPSLLACDSMDGSLRRATSPLRSNNRSPRHLHWQTRLGQEDLQSRPSCFPLVFSSPVSSRISLGNGSCNCSPFVLILALWRNMGQMCASLRAWDARASTINGRERNFLKAHAHTPNALNFLIRFCLIPGCSYMIPKFILAQTCWHRKNWFLDVLFYTIWG